MSELSAGRALAYATEDELMKLYAVVVGGWVVTLGSQVLLTTGGMGLALGIVGLLAGILGSLVGIVALAYKVIHDSRL
ncbi:hypothetical protein ACFQJC_09750 [Haloferax namakaokahaiae]|uniref:Uncharacterized protein n=1 Tax=Haloferax namakaokahaiae TaxID=1748331 RepID=A0ABD5ZFR5_9EURY